MTAQEIIIRPIITEKTMAGVQEKKYTFEVAKAATKSISQEPLKNFSVLRSARLTLFMLEAECAVRVALKAIQEAGRKQL